MSQVRPSHPTSGTSSGTTSGQRRPLPWVWAAACLVGGWIGWALPVADALEFSADQITRSQGHTRKANIYYRDDRWRLEHYAPGPVNVTIVRKDKQVMWLLLSRIRHFKAVPYDPDQEPKVEERLKGETAREIIGTETRDGHPTTLYQVTVQDGGGEQIYYQWVATDIGFPLKLARKDGSWMVEYRNLRLRPQSDALFELPVNFKPLEELERKDDGSPGDPA